MGFLERFKKGFTNYGLRGLLLRGPGFIRSRIRRFFLYPSFLTRFGVGRNKWKKTQIEHELNFWNNRKIREKLDGSENYHEEYIHGMNSKIKNIRLDFAEGTVIDIGCGAEGGILPFINARYKIGIDPLVKEYSKNYTFSKDVIMISAMAEDIPLISESVDACFCINVLDHVMRPYKVMAEIYRTLKKGGYFAFSVDIGGTKKHPIKIYESDVDAFFEKHPFEIIEKKCGLNDSSHWGKTSGIPQYIFQGYKK